MNHFVQGLESRRLLSVSPAFFGHPAPPPPDATITADLAAVKAAETAVGADGKALWTAEGALFTAEKAALKTTPVMNAQAALATAQATAKPLIQADLKAIAAVYMKDEPAIVADFKQLLKDHGSATAIAADKKKLAADQATLAADLKVAQTKFTTDQAPVIAAAKGVQAALSADPGVVAAQATVTADQVTLKTAETTLATAIQKLNTDLKNHA